MDPGDLRMLQRVLFGVRSAVVGTIITIIGRRFDFGRCSHATGIRGGVGLRREDSAQRVAMFGLKSKHEQQVVALRPRRRRRRSRGVKATFIDAIIVRQDGASVRCSRRCRRHQRGAGSNGDGLLARRGRERAFHRVDRGRHARARIAAAPSRLGCAERRSVHQGTAWISSMDGEGELLFFELMEGIMHRMGDRLLWSRRGRQAGRSRALLVDEARPGLAWDFREGHAANHRPPRLRRWRNLPALPGARCQSRRCQARRSMLPSR